MKRKILFISGTRADYGKIKPLLKKLEYSKSFSPHIYVCGMHLLEQYGGTYREILKDNYSNVHISKKESVVSNMSVNIGNLIIELTEYIKNMNFDMIVVHGDRTDALGGAIVGALNNVRVAHIEGGEISGTIDDSMRHAISKIAHFHFVCNEEAKHRLIQMGESKSRVFVIGSPDIDIMFSDSLPTFNEAKKKYDITFDKYGILMFHPVTTEYIKIKDHAKSIVNAVVESDKNYIVVYPNNDIGSEEILAAYDSILNNKRFRIFPSLSFEHFLTLLKNADFMIGNSSAGVRETGIYGIPSIDVGTRQNSRYSLENSKNIIHVGYKTKDILTAINLIESKRITTSNFGDGHSSEKFVQIISNKKFWNFDLQKKFIDLE
ncbi:MAG: UDP-N-acetylglucosamine 2-epimerase [Acholeplasma sp.]|nr:UDP-N-acetylglucosamine 2-epimerase [Acholeplasma sp.]